MTAARRGCLPVAGKLKSIPRPALGPRRARRPARPASPASRRPAPQRPCHRPRRRPRRAARVLLRHRLGRLGGDRPVLLDQHGRYAQLLDLHLVRVRDDPPRKTSLEPGIAVSRSATSPPVHDSAVASVQPARPALGQNDLRDRPLVLGEQVLGDSRAPSTPESSSPRPRRGRRGSRSRGRRRSPPPRPLAAGLRERARDCRLAHAVEAQHAANRRFCTREDTPDRLASPRRLPQPLQLLRWPGQGDGDARPRAPGRRPARSRRGRATVRLPGAKPASSPPARTRA